MAIPLLAGCATTQKDCQRPIGVRGLTPALAAERGSVPGHVVTWGGKLVESRNLRDATELEILAFPLDTCGRPTTAEAPLGRFIMSYPGYLETAELTPGREVTASGPIIATSQAHIGEAEYRFPVIEDANPRIWPKAAAGSTATRPSISIGIGGGRGWSGGGVGVTF
jgi:outer membrane lipoprotein